MPTLASLTPVFSANSRVSRVSKARASAFSQRRMRRSRPASGPEWDVQGGDNALLEIAPPNDEPFVDTDGNPVDRDGPQIPDDNARPDEGLPPPDDDRPPPNDDDDNRAPGGKQNLVLVP